MEKFKFFIKKEYLKIIILLLMTSLTLSIHLIFLPFPHAFHLIHRRLCYFPVVLGALWFGLKGGIGVAFLISLFTFRASLNYENIFFNEEMVEIFFYFSLGLFSGILVEGIKREKKKSEELTKELMKKEKLALQGQMASAVAHEIRTPLSSIKGSFEILKRNFTNEHPHKEFVNIAAEELKRMEGVVEDFLYLSKPLSIKEKCVIEVNDAVKKALKSLSNFAEDKNVKIDFLEFINNIYFEGDPSRIHQALTNIIKNAIQASPKGTVKIRIQKEGLYIKISVEDSGKGIDPEEFDKIFEPFYTKKEGGFGLGLAIVKIIIEAHKGEIIAKNGDRGALFEIKLKEKQFG